VAELALDDVQRDAFVSEFDGMRVTQLMWREATAYAGPGRKSAQHGASRGGLPKAGRGSGR